MRQRIVSIILLIFALCLFSCKEDPIPPGPEIVEEPGLSEDSIIVYQGEIGLFISARDVARKGYKPTHATITISGNTYDTTGTFPIDEYTNLAFVSKKRECLTAEQIEELERSGVELDIKVFDADQNELGTSSASKVFFTSSMLTVDVPLTSTLTDQNSSILAFKEGIEYYLQIVDPNTNNVKYAVGHESYLTTTHDNSMTYNLSGLHYQDHDSRAYQYSSYQFEQVPNEPGVFNIGFHKDGKVFYLHIKGAPNHQIGVQNLYNWQINGGATVAANYINYKFKIEPVGSGLYTFRSVSTGNLLTLELTPRLAAGNTNPNPSDIAYFRIVNLDIDWNFTPLDYKQLQPILPQAKTDFAFNSTLINCSSGNLEQMVGREQTKETTLTSSWEESMSVSASSSFSLSMTSEAEVSANFFGGSASAKQSVTGTVTVGVSATKSKSRAGERSSKKIVTVSSQRTIDVPSKKATLVSDMYQTYTNIEIPFVQRFKVEGNYPNGEGPLTGEEIITQFNFNGFTGVVTEKGENYILVNVRGTNRIDELIETTTIAKDLATDCD